MADKIQLSIVTPEKHIVSNEVDQVNVPGSEGDLGILLDHSPLITTLRAGPFSYEIGEEVVHMVLSGGYMEVTENRVTVLAETAEFLDDIDRNRAEKSKAHAEEMLERSDLTEEQFRETQYKLFRAVARLESKKE